MTIAWIKVQVTLPNKSEVLAITEMMGWDSTHTTVGALISAWCWFDQHTESGNAPSVTFALLDRYLGVTGFSKAMESVGWLKQVDGGIQIPNFDFHNGKTAKTRGLAAKRANKFKSNARSVTKALPECEISNGDSVTSALPRVRVRIKDTTTAPSIPEGVDPQVWDSWLSVRKSKKATAMSDLVIAGISREAQKAGISLNDAILKCVEKNWISFDADWVNKPGKQVKPIDDQFAGMK